MDGSDSGSDELHLGGQVSKLFRPLLLLLRHMAPCGAKSALQMIIPGCPLGGTR